MGEDKYVAWRPAGRHDTNTWLGIEQNNIGNGACWNCNDWKLEVRCRRNDGGHFRRLQRLDTLAGRLGERRSSAPAIALRPAL